MKTGLSFFFMGTGKKGTDRDVYRDEIALAEMAEPLGFDSVRATEHHFTDYSMVPNPLQFLAYMAGQTSRIDLGSMVVVLPWHNPARLAGEISMVDNLANGRFRLGIGRGLGRVEFDGLGAECQPRERYSTRLPRRSSARLRPASSRPRDVRVDPGT